MSPELVYTTILSYNLPKLNLVLRGGNIKNKKTINKTNKKINKHKKTHKKINKYKKIHKHKKTNKKLINENYV